MRQMHRRFGYGTSLACVYNVCTLVCAMMVCVGIQGRKTRLLRVGIYLFTIMEWVSAVGYGCFSLSDSIFAATGFNAVLGLQLFWMKLAEQDCTVSS